MYKMDKNDEHTHTHTHNHFTALWILSETTRVSRYQKKNDEERSFIRKKLSEACYNLNTNGRYLTLF